MEPEVKRSFKTKFVGRVNELEDGSWDYSGYNGNGSFQVIEVKGKGIWQPDLYDASNRNSLTDEDKKPGTYALIHHYNSPRARFGNGLSRHYVLATSNDRADLEGLLMPALAVMSVADVFFKECSSAPENYRSEALAQWYQFHQLGLRGKQLFYRNGGFLDLEEKRDVA